jgi:hypothetical protein
LKQLKNIEFKLRKKVAEKHLDEIIDDFYRAFCENKSEATYIFDFSDVEWMSNEELLTLTALFKSLIDSEIEFKVNFLKNGSSEAINERKARQFVQLWDVWKIFTIVPHADFNLYFDLDGNTIDRFKKRYNITSVAKEIYESYGVTPFVALEKIDSYDDQRIIEKLADTYRLEAATSEILKDNDCYLPFHNETLSSIISKELYENFLDHFTNSVFGSVESSAFLSLVLKKKLNSDKLDPGSLQAILKRNFEDESLPELIDFYVEKGKSRVYRNRSILQLSFVDFGEGIPKTLKTSYLNNSGRGYSELHMSQQEDTRILEYAFKYNSSQHELKDKYKQDFTVPRGLFDLLSIVKRFEGAIIARSNYGKVAFDFSNGKSIEDAVRYFGDQSKFFPGTLFTIFIPERETNSEIDSSSIKPFESIGDYSFSKENVKHVSLFEIQTIQKSKKLDKKDFYNELFNSFLNKVENNEESLIYLDFKGWEIDERVTRKIVFFLCTDYRVNLKNNAIAINPPSKAFLASIKDELLALNDIDRKFKIHPTPFVSFNNGDLEIFWLGIFSEKDVNKLNDLLFEEHDLRKIDFENPEDIVGHVNSYDLYGNLSSVIDSESILSFYKQKALEIEEQDVLKVIDSCIKSVKDSIYLCNGNYYQYEYLQLFDALSNREKRDFINEILLKKLIDSIDSIKDYVFVGITSSSHKIIDYFETHPNTKNCRFVRLYNYFSFENEQDFRSKLFKHDKVILLCDVISTGYMVSRVHLELNKITASLEYIGVIVNAIDPQYSTHKLTNTKLSSRVVSVYEKPLKKYDRANISSELISGALSVIRVNPFTNTPITQSISESNLEGSVLLENKDFLSLISSEQINVGYYNFNSLIHPYFFNMDSILTQTHSSKALVASLFQKLKNTKRLNKTSIIFFPKNCAIKYLDFEFLRDTILKNHSVEIYELERFSTTEGWRFSHPPQQLKEISNGKEVLILDDGSCSGESILQMIDEVAFLGVSDITVLSVVGRLNDHKREFFSRIKSIENKGESINVDIFFGSNWHIPTYYLSKSPVVEEKRWLDELVNFPNTPQFIRAIALEILNEVGPKDVKKGNNNYLVTARDGSSIAKDLILVRDEIGKITDFRFYQESFNFFDDFIAIYESKSKNTRGDSPYKLIETICAVFLHEPYLFDAVRKVVPDVVDKIKEFANRLFWSEKTIDLDDLHFKWTRKNLFHLIFILYRDDELFDLLSVKKLKVLINEFVISNSDLSYVLFKMSKYLSFTDTQNATKNYSGNLLLLINKIIEDGGISEDKLRVLKRFRSFAATLISDADFESLLSIVKTNYEKITDDKYHNDWMSTHNDTLLIQLEVLNSNYNKESERKVLSSFEKISSFIDPILELSRSFPEFFNPLGETIIIDLEKKLRTKYGQLSDDLFQISPTSDLNEIRKNAGELYDKYIRSESYFYKLFRHLLTMDIKKEYETFLDSVRNEYENIEIEEFGELSSGVSLEIPLKMIREVLFGQLLKNFRHANPDHAIKIEWAKTSTLLKLKITNHCLLISEENGGGTGMVQLNSLNNYPNSSISYSYNRASNLFIQNIDIKI